MPKLPSGLTTFEATDTVSRLAQNENIEATDALFHSTTGHKHSAKAGDAPQITADGLAAGAVTTDKIAANAITNHKLAVKSVTSEKIADASIYAAQLAPEVIERKHIRTSGLSSNIAKFKKVTITGGTLTGNPTTPYTFSTGSTGDNHAWILPKNTVLPQSITIDLGKTYRYIEGMSFGSLSGSEARTAPWGFYIEVSADNQSWFKVYTAVYGVYEPFSYIPFVIANCTHIRLTVTHSSTSDQTVLSCISAFSRFHGNLDMDVLEDQRAWGLNARLQGLMIACEGKVTDTGTGTLTIETAMIVMNPAAGTYFRIKGGTYVLPVWGYLYVDIPYTSAVEVTPQIGVWTEDNRSYDHKNRLVIAQRVAAGYICFNSAMQSRLVGTSPDADRVDGIDFRVSASGGLEFSNDQGAGWRGVGIKSVQRGVTTLAVNTTLSEYFRTITISPVNRSKSFINIHHTGTNHGTYNSIYHHSDTSIYATFTSDSALYLYVNYLTTLNLYIVWEVIEFA